MISRPHHITLNLTDAEYRAMLAAAARNPSLVHLSVAQAARAMMLRGATAKQRGGPRKAVAA